MSIKVEEKCRTCLRTDGPLISLFNSKLTQYDLDQNSVIDLLTSFTKIQISAEDEFSHQICIECLGEIERIYSFKLKCEQSDATLRTLKNVQTKTLIKCEYQSETDLYNDEYDECHKEIDESDEEEQTATFSESGMTDTDQKSCDEIIVKHEENAADEHMQSDASEIKLEKDLQESVCPKENVKEEPALDISIDEWLYDESDSEPEKTPDESIDEIIECPACFVQYVGIDDLKTHIIDNHTEGKLCRLCNTEFDCESQHCWYHLRGISQHRTGKNQKPNEFQCTICLKRFATKWFLKRHVKRHTEEKSFKCEICSKMFKKKQALESHAIVQHSTQSVSDDHQCKICSKMFGNKYHLLRHSKIHSEEKPFKCEICLKSFKQKRSLECHVIVAHSTKSNKAKNDLQCKICLKIFGNKAYLLRHTQMHTEEKPYQCEICLKTFKKKQALECHNIVFHFTQPVSDELQCKICSKIFGNKSHLIRHSKVHTDETTLKCDICSKSFLRKNNLTTHMRQRHGIEMNNSRNEDVKCELCSRLVGNQLVRHLRCHTKETPFKCEVCSKAFRYKSNMKVHMRLKHASESAELIFYNDGFPDRICADCLEEIQQIYSFKIKCEKSENILKQSKCVKADLGNSDNSPNTYKDECEDDHCIFEIKMELEEINEYSEEQQSGRTAENGVIVKCEEFTNDSEQSWKMIGERNISLREQSETDYSLKNIKEEPELNIATISTEYENEEQNFEENKEKSSLESLGVRCPSCPYECASRDKVKNHFIAKHMEGKVCKICNKEFECSPIQHLFEHLSTKPNAKRRISNPNSKCPFKCEICWNRFTYRFSLKNHMRISHEIFESDDENYFQCKKCCKIFERKCNLLRHVRNYIHTNTTPFECGICSKIFRRYYNLTLHMSRKHSDVSDNASTENSFQCKVCSKTFEHKAYLRQHEKIHSDERPFKCDLCKQTFRHKKNLKSHVQAKHTRTPKTVYQCESCSKSFEEEADLDRHFQSHSNEEPEFKCEICSKQFERKDQLTVHMGMKHAIGQLALKFNSSWSIFKVSK